MKRIAALKPARRQPRAREPGQAALVDCNRGMRVVDSFALMTYIPFYYNRLPEGHSLHAEPWFSISAWGVVRTLTVTASDKWGHKKVLMLSLGLTSLFFRSSFYATRPALFGRLRPPGMT
jgi:hypothetical protein